MRIKQLTELFLITILLFEPNIAFSMAESWQLGMQEGVTPVMKAISELHNFVMYIITGIVIFVFSLIVFVCIRFSKKNNPTPAKFSHNFKLEAIWTIIPCIILVFIAFPSFKTLRIIEKTPKADITIKVVGYQWYWHYIYPDHGDFGFDSYMLTDSERSPDQPRLLAVDNKIVIPQGKVVKFLITAGDVIHNFFVPALGIKMDAVPGKVNETWTIVEEPGTYYGQCSELCGVNHGFMPIAIEVVSQEEFDRWVTTSKTKFANISTSNKLVAGVTN